MRKNILKSVNKVAEYVAENEKPNRIFLLRILGI